MSHDRPCSEESAGIQRRLQRLRPRPVQLDAEQILQAAEVADSAAPAPDDVPSRRTARWMVFSAGWSSGAIAGALLTLLLLHSAAAPETKPGQADQPSPLQTTVAEEAGPQAPVTDEPPQAGGQQEAAAGWSDSELLVSTELLGPYPAGAAWGNAAPLRVGSFVRPQATLPAQLQNSSAAHHRIPQETAPATGSFWPARPISRDRLLHELLGRPPASL